MQYPLEEKIGPPELLVGHAKEFADFNQWLAGIPNKRSKSRVILARRKSGKTSFVQRIFNQLWTQNGMVIPFYGVDDSELNLIDVQERVPYYYSDGRSEEIDIIAKSDDGRILMIEVRKRQQATGIKAVQDLRDNAVDYAQQHGVTVLPAFLSLGGFTKKALEFCAENDIAVAQEIDFYGSE